MLGIYVYQGQISLRFVDLLSFIDVDVCIVRGTNALQARQGKLLTFTDVDDCFSCGARPYYSKWDSVLVT